MYTERVRINRVTTTLYDMGLAVPVTKFIHSISKNDFENNKIVNTQTITSPQMVCLILTIILVKFYMAGVM